MKASVSTLLLNYLIKALPIYREGKRNKMSRYMTIDFKLHSIWFSDDIEDYNNGGSCRYGDMLDLIRDVEKVLEGYKKKELETREYE